MQTHCGNSSVKRPMGSVSESVGGAAWGFWRVWPPCGFRFGGADHRTCCVDVMTSLSPVSEGGPPPAGGGNTRESYTRSAYTNRTPHDPPCATETVGRSPSEGRRG